MGKDTGKAPVDATGFGISLEDVLRDGARGLIQKSVEVELQQLWRTMRTSARSGASARW